MKDFDLLTDMCAHEPALLKEEGALGTILHVLCSNASCPTEMIQWVLEQAPELARRPTKNGYLPHHYIRTFNVAKLLIEAYPEGLKHADSCSSLPLHHIVKKVRNFQIPSLAAGTIKYVVGKYPAALVHRNDFLDTPLNVVAQQCKNKIYSNEGDALLQALMDMEKELREESSGLTDESKIKTTEQQTVNRLVEEVNALKVSVAELTQRNETLIQRLEALERVDVTA